MVETSTLVTKKKPQNDDFLVVLKLEDECLHLKKTKSNEINQTQNNSEETQLNHSNVIIERHGGMYNTQVLVILITWYIISALTLFSNKYILTVYKGNTTFLGKFSI
jgi:hypothetical protein